MRFSSNIFRPQIGILQFPRRVLFVGAPAKRHNGKIISGDVCYVAVLGAGETL